MESFYNQYSISKTEAIKAIANGYNVVLFGEGCNGKTYLTNELIKESILDMNLYRMISREHEAEEDSKKNYWIECDRLDYAMNKVKSENFVLINMNRVCHPDEKMRRQESKRSRSPLYRGYVIDAYGHC